MHRRIAYLALSLLLAALACARESGSNSSGGGGLQTMVSGGEDRQYLLHVPPDLGDAPVPLVLNLHGFSATAAEQERLSGMSAVADEAGFIVVYPQALGTPPTWRVGPLEGGANELAFLSDLIDDLISRYPIDHRQIYATGISNGGGMVDRLGCEMADRLAAIASVSGAYLFYRDCQPSRPMPVLAFHGTGDEIVPYAGQGRVLPPVRTWAESWATRDRCQAAPDVVLEQGAVTGERWSGCGGTAEVVLYTIEGGGHWWPGADFLPGADKPTDDIDATATIWAFFQAHSLP